MLHILRWSFALIAFAAAGSVFAAADGVDLARSVLTQHNDEGRTGWYRSESILSPKTVTPRTFGEVARLHVAGMITAQPLYVHGVLIDGVIRNMLYVATNENIVYGFDVGAAGSRPVKTPLIRTQTFGNIGGALLPGMIDGPVNKQCNQSRWNVGIMATPVIDPATLTMYVVYRIGKPPGPARAGPPGPGNYQLGSSYALAQLDIRTLAVIKSVPIVRPATVRGGLLFDADMQANRPALLLHQGMVYVAFGLGTCDYGDNPYLKTSEKPLGHGWVFAFSTGALERPPAIFTTTPATSLGGIWQSGNGLAASGASVFALTGNNGMVNSPAAPEFAESLVKLTARAGTSGVTLAAARMLAGNWYRLDSGHRSPSDTTPTHADSDLGAGGPVVLPLPENTGATRIVGGGKQGRVYVVDPGSLRQTQAAFQGFFNTWHPETDVCDYDRSQEYGPNMHGSVVAWHPAGVPYAQFFAMPEKEYLKGFTAYDDGRIDPWAAVTTVETGERAPDGMPGGFLSISSNGGDDGIIWVSVARHEPPVPDPKMLMLSLDATYNEIPGRLLAFDARTLRELWNDDSSPGENFVKFAVPTIADGRVFRASYDGPERRTDGSTAGTVIVYGLRTDSAGHVPSGALPRIRAVDGSWDAARQRLDLFTSASDGDVVSTQFRSYGAGLPASAGCVDAWRGWYPLTDAHPAAGGFAPVSTVRRPNRDHIDAFMVGDDGAVRSNYAEAGRWRTSWFTLRPQTGRAAPGAPVTALWHDANTLDLFVVGIDGVVLTIRFSHDAWAPQWTSIGTASGVASATQPVTAVWWPRKNRLALYLTGSDGQVKWNFADRSGWQNDWTAVGPQSLHAVPGQLVTAVWHDRNQLNLLATNDRGKIRMITTDANSATSAWLPLDPDDVGAAVAGQPITALTRPQSNHLDLFMVGTDGHVQSMFFENGVRKSLWFELRPASFRAFPGQPVTAIWRNDKHLDLFASAADGRISSIYFANDAWQPAWFRL